MLVGCCPASGAGEAEPAHLFPKGGAGDAELRRCLLDSAVCRVQRRRDMRAFRRVAPPRPASCRWWFARCRSPQPHPCPSACPGDRETGRAAPVAARRRAPRHGRCGFPARVRFPASHRRSRRRAPAARRSPPRRAGADRQPRGSAQSAARSLQAARAAAACAR